MHWLRSTGSEYWNSDGAYLNTMRRGLSLKESVDKTKISDFVKTDVYRGDFQQTFRIMNVDFIAGADFSIYRPISQRQFLDDRGIVDENESLTLADSTLGEKIEIDEYGSYLQATVGLPFSNKICNCTALR